MNKPLQSLIAVLALAPAGVWAGQEPRPPAPPSFVRASGDSQVEVKPDQATVRIGVVTQALTAAAAAAQNASKTTAVLDKIRAEIATKGTVRTTGYSVNPNFSYPNPPNSGGPKIVGYNASNTVEVKLDDIAIVGRVLDVAMATGANNVQGVEFSVKDEHGVRAQALRQAAQNARVAAEAMASALGLRVLRVQSAEAGGSNIVRPMQDIAAPRMAALATAPPTPVEPGNVQVRETVTVTLEVAP